MAYIVNPALGRLEFAKDRHREYIEAVNKHGGFRAAERALDLADDTISGAIRRLKQKAVMQGYSPEHMMVHTVPEPLAVKRISTNYAGDGSVSQQWVIAEPKKQAQLEAILAAIHEATKPIERLPPLERPVHTQSQLCNLYTFTDCHMGMLAWHEEGGADWDIEIAEKVLFSVFEQMISQAPSARVAVVNIQGDFLHWDGLEAVTPTSKHPVDAAGRFPQVIKATRRVIQRIIDLALLKHDEVHFIAVEGNHDLGGSAWLREMFAALYENEPRFSINASELPYYAFEFGQTMLGFHHGHKRKKESLPLYFAAKFYEMWGRTKKRYIHVGHYHNEDITEYAGVKVHQHPTIAAADSHASRGGWLSERQASCITYHERFGKVSETVVTPEMLCVH